MAQPATELTADSDKRWMTYREAGAYTGLDRVTLWRAVKRGDLRAGGVGRAVRFHRDELDRWMKGTEEN